MKFRFALYSVMAASLVGLAACAGFGNVSSDVASYGAWPADRKPSTFAFERLPSQQSKDVERQTQLETAAANALQKVGFSLAADPKTADVTVMVGARISLTEISPWDDPFWWHHRTAFWRHSPMWRPYGYGNNYNLAMGNRRYDREVALVLRDRASGEAMYEARASSDGLTMGDDTLIGAMFEAAVKDFPRTVSESHVVSVQIPR